MKPSDSLEAFKAFMASRGASMEHQGPRNAFNLMSRFFQCQPADGCDGEGSDMLLFQWGTYDWGNGSHFEVNLTRQFIEPEGEGDDAISQLSLTFKFRETPALTEVGEGNLWCKDHGQLNNFMEFINSSTALTAAENHDVVAIEIQHSYV